MNYSKVLAYLIWISFIVSGPIHAMDVAQEIRLRAEKDLKHPLNDMMQAALIAANGILDNKQLTLDSPIITNAVASALLTRQIEALKHRLANPKKLESLNDMPSKDGAMPQRIGFGRKSGLVFDPNEEVDEDDGSVDLTKTVKNDGKFYCDMVDCSGLIHGFGSQRALWAHYRVHGGRNKKGGFKGFACDGCNKIFYYKNAFNNHCCKVKALACVNAKKIQLKAAKIEPEQSSSSRADKIFPCPTCTMTFTDQKYLLTHKCRFRSLCGLQFTRRREYEVHEAECSDCSSFKRESARSNALPSRSATHSRLS